MHLLVNIKVYFKNCVMFGSVLNNRREPIIIHELDRAQT
jgi:hypothetical protein